MTGLRIDYDAALKAYDEHGGKHSEALRAALDASVALLSGQLEMAERRGAIKALRKAADELDARTTVGILRARAVDRLRGYAENIESGEVSLP